MIYNFERTQLIHQVTTRIKVDPVKAYSETSICDSCGEQQAQWYCLNDQAYFCDECYNNVHSNMNSNTQNFLANHKRVTVEKRPKDFGECKEHKKANEYFNQQTSIAYCSMCVVEGLQKTEGSGGSKQSQTSLIDIEKAYSNALNDANKEDIALSEKKKVIEGQLQAVKKKMSRIKENALSIQQQLTDILEKTLSDMHDII